MAHQDTSGSRLSFRERFCRGCIITRFATVSEPCLDRARRPIFHQMGWRHLHKCVDWTLSDDLNLARSCLLDNLRLETLDEHALQSTGQMHPQPNAGAFFFSRSSRRNENLAVNQRVKRQIPTGDT